MLERQLRKRGREERNGKRCRDRKGYLALNRAAALSTRLRIRGFLYHDIALLESI